MESILPQIDLKVYGRLALRWAWLVILCGLVAGVIAYAYSSSQTRIYQAISKVMINEARSPANPNYNDILTSERAARTYANLMQRDSTIRETLARLGLDVDAVRKQVGAVSVSPVRDTQLVQVSVESPNPELAAAVANSLPPTFADGLRKIQLSRFAESKASLAQQLDELSRQIEAAQLRIGALENTGTVQAELELSRLRNELVQYQTSRANLLNSYEALRLTEAQSVDNIVLIEPADAPLGPVRPRVLVNTLLAVVVGALLALGVVFLLEYLDDRVRTPDDLRRIADVPVMGAIARVPANLEAENNGVLLSIAQPRHPIVEAYRRLRANLQYYSLDATLRSMVVTSAEAGEGKSMTSANLAVVMAQSGLSVILVDADLRKPKQHRMWGLPRQPGLAEALVMGEVPPGLLNPVAGVPNLRILTAGEKIPNPAEVLGSLRMQHMAEKLLEIADMVIYDTPPVLAVADAPIMARITDGALLVINSQKTSSAAIHRALEAMLQVNVHVMGAVLNQLTAMGRSYYYYYNNDYYADSDGEEGKKKGRRRRSKSQAAAEMPPAPGQQPAATQNVGD